MKESELKIACIGAGCSGCSHMSWFERRVPGSVVAFCDLDRTYFDEFMAGVADSGHFQAKVLGLREEEGALDVSLA